MITNYEDNMAGPYSDTKTKVVVIIYEHTIYGMDAPSYNEIDQDEFSESADELTHETLQFC